MCPERKEDDGSPAEPPEIELQHWLNDVERMAELRQRLASPLWLAPITLDPQRRLNALLGQWFDGAEGIQWADLAATDEDATNALAAVTPVTRSETEAPEVAPQTDQAVAVA